MSPTACPFGEALPGSSPVQPGPAQRTTRPERARHATLCRECRFSTRQRVSDARTPSCLRQLRPMSPRRLRTGGRRPLRSGGAKLHGGAPKLHTAFGAGARRDARSVPLGSAGRALARRWTGLAELAVLRAHAWPRYWSCRCATGRTPSTSGPPVRLAVALVLRVAPRQPCLANAPAFEVGILRARTTMGKLQACLGGALQPNMPVAKWFMMETLGSQHMTIAIKSARRSLRTKI